MDELNDDIIEAPKPEVGKFQITFFRGIDPTSLYTWDKKRMTGLSISWYFQDEKGNKIQENLETKNDVEENRFFTNCVKTMEEASKVVTEENLWDIFNGTKKEYIVKYSNNNVHKEMKHSSSMFLDFDLTAFGTYVYRFIRN